MHIFYTNTATLFFKPQAIISLSKKYSTLGQGKKLCTWGGSIPNPLQSRPLVTPHTQPNVPSTAGSISGRLLSSFIAFRTMSSRLSRWESFCGLLIWGTTRNHKEPCLESREPGEQLECRVWTGNSRSGVMNEPGHCL
jgi:hypothetical protein